MELPLQRNKSSKYLAKVECLPGSNPNLWQAAVVGRPQGAPSDGQFAAYRDGGDDASARKYDVEYAERAPKELY